MRSPDLAFFISADGVVSWNYVTGERHLLSDTAFNYLSHCIVAHASVSISKELIEAGLLVPVDSEKEEWVWGPVGKISHFGGFLSPRDITDSEVAAREYVEFCSSIMAAMPSDAFCTRRGDGDLALPSEPIFNRVTLCEALTGRVTNRRFSGEEISFQTIAQLLTETFSYKEHDQNAYGEMGMQTPTYRRTSPSGGSLQCCEGYLLARRVTGLDAGVYHFRSHANNLGRIGDLPADGLRNTFCNQAFAEDLSAAVVITCRFDKMMWKYKHPRSYRVCLLDAGHLSQTMQLLATALDLRTWPTAAFYDADMSGLLGLLPSQKEFPLMAIGFGSGPADPFDRDLGGGFRHGQ